MKSMTRLLILVLFVVLLTACGGGESEPTYTPEMIAEGEAIFGSTCAVCHGPGGKGLPNLGKDMTTSDFIAEKSDQELIDFIKVGRPPGDPDNTTGVDMPPKGGNPALSDEDFVLIIAFIRSVQQ
jgi:disulfide bond formation protein DsbB